MNYFLRFFLLMAAFGSAAGAVRAAVVITTDSRLNAAAYTVATNDLFQTSLAGLTHSGALYVPEIQPARLADGQFGATGGDFNSFAFLDGGSVTFSLDLAASPQGYDLTELVTYAGWDNFRDGQEYSVEYSTAEDPADFRPLVSVPQFNPPGSGSSSTRVSLTGSTGVLLRNVAKVRFTFTNFESGATFYREIDAIGTPSTGTTAQVPQLINYQGRVAVGTTAFNGAGLFKFALVNGAGTATHWSNDGTSTNGSQPTAAVSLTVANGLYSVLLGETTVPNMTVPIAAGVFAHAHVRLRVWFNDGVNGFQLLTPDQRIAAVGYALMAADVPDGTITAAKLAPGAVTAASLPDGAITAAKLADGAVTAAKLAAGAIAGSSLADGSITGAKLAPGVIGSFDTTGSAPLDLKVNGQRALRLYDAGDSSDTGTEPDGAPNIIGGAAGNSITAGTVGSTIAGGGAANYFGTPFYNSIAADFSFVGGGYGNAVQADARFAFIGAGRFNAIRTEASESVISGGLNNVIQGTAFRSVIGGGEGNVLQTGASFSVIAGGYLNSIVGGYAFVAGGESNVAGPASFAAGRRAKATHAGSFVWADSTEADFLSTANKQFSVRAGGGARFETAGVGLFVDGAKVMTEGASSGITGVRVTANAPASGSFNVVIGAAANSAATGISGATISGGGAALYNGLARPNAISGDYGTVSGGFANTSGLLATVAGGSGNTAAGAAATIGGGDGNSASGLYSTVPGGRLNEAVDNAFAAGTRAKARHAGSFVWADATPQGDFVTTANNQVLFKAAGGLGINKNNPATALDVNGTVTATAFVGSGAGLTDITLANVISGTVPDNSLSTNVVTRNSNQTFNNSVLVGTGTYINPLTVNSAGTASGGRAGLNEVTARFRSTAGGASAVAVDAVSGQDAAVYLSENNAAIWSLREVSADFHKFNLRYHAGGVNNTILSATSDGQVDIGGGAVSGSLYVHSTGQTVTSLESSNTTGTQLSLSNTSTGGKEWSVLSSGSGHSQGAGKLQFVSSQSSTPRATLDGAGNLNVAGSLNVVGDITATGNVQAKNLPGIEFTKGEFNFPDFRIGYQGENLPIILSLDIDLIEVDVPAAGFLLVSAEVEGVFVDGTNSYILDIFNVTANRTEISRTVRGGAGTTINPTVVIPVSAGKLSFRSVLRAEPAAGETDPNPINLRGHLKGHALRALYFPVRY